jgi:hypothetical protein
MKRIILASVFFFALCSCERRISKERISDGNNTITIRIGHPGIDLKNQYPGAVKVERQPAGLTFYQVNWRATEKGKIKLDMSDSSFVFDDVLGMIGTEDNGEKNPGIYRLTIISKITDSNHISHEDARIKFLSILKKIKSSGWSTLIPFTAPRLRGKDMVNYLLESKNPTALDSSYDLSMSEWMNIDNLTSWEFNKGNIFLEVSFSRNSEEIGAQPFASYVVRYTVKSDVAYFKEFIDSNATEPWESLLIDELKNSAERRRSLEELLEKNGIKIDKEYMNSKPPISSIDH